MNPVTAPLPQTQIETPSESEEEPSLAPPPFQSPAGSANAAAPDIMEPKGDDSHLGDNEWTAQQVISDGQRMRFGPIAKNTHVVDPDAGPIGLHIPPGSDLKLIVELYFEEGSVGEWRSDGIGGPYLRLVYLPYDADGRLMMNGFFQDARLIDKNAEGFNVVFENLTLNPGELSLWYYECGSMPVKKQTWDEALFLPPELHDPAQADLAAIDFKQLWDFAAQPFTRHLGTFRQENLEFHDQPTNQTYTIQRAPTSAVLDNHLIGL
ncbi:MAG TPA: hypothetical protein VJR29_02820 [bacterium]|nr:hypothetical protein [bacterium]